MSKFVTMSKFAEMQGIHRSTVTRWKQTGRLVMTENNKKVDVEASLKKIKNTEGHRTDMKEKHAQNRGHEITEQEPKNSIEDDNEDMSATETTIGSERANIKAKKLDFENKLIQLKARIESGETLYLDDFMKDIEKKATGIKSGIERLIDNLAPQLTGLSQTERNTRIQSEINKFIEQI